MIVTDLQEARSFLAQSIRKSRGICFFTGAGISTPSGIPDFRSPGGIWSQYRIIEYSDFISDEEARLEDWDRRFHMAALFAKAQPNAAHLLIADLIKNGDASGLITQNIDGLHQRAGVPDDRIVEFHGTGAYAHCLDCRKRYEIDQTEEDMKTSGKAPTCSCGGYIKAAVVSFGEAIPETYVERSLAFIDGADLLIAIGSSLQVWPAAGLVERAKQQGCDVIIINRDETPFDAMATAALHVDICDVTENLL